MKENKKLRVMISQPMNGKSKEEINKVHERAIKLLEGNCYEVIETRFTDEVYEILKRNGIVNRPLWYLAKSLRTMSKCDAVYFCKDWENARGCCIEHSTAFAYGLKIMYEESEE